MASQMVCLPFHGLPVAIHEYCSLLQGISCKCVGQAGNNCADHVKPCMLQPTRSCSLHQVTSSKCTGQTDVLCTLQANEVQNAVLQQQLHTWNLLFVLYVAIEDASEVSLPHKPTLPEMLRRAALSSWLQVGPTCCWGRFCR